MKREPLRNLLDFAVEVAWHAGRVTLGYFQTGVSAEFKADSTPVTAADRGAEQVARQLIEARFPADGIMGEEFGNTRSDAVRRWILDPIDGTKSFVQGVPLYGVLVALEEAGEPVLGVIHFPALSETVFAARGEGCWWNGRPARVSEVTRLEDAVLLTTDVDNMVARGYGDSWNQLCRRSRLVRNWGDCYGHALVATGRAEAMVDPELEAWDAAPLLPIVEEAGGVFTDFQGNCTHQGGQAISTNTALAAEIRSVLGE